MREVADVRSADASNPRGGEGKRLLVDRCSCFVVRVQATVSSRLDRSSVTERLVLWSSPPALIWKMPSASLMVVNVMVAASVCSRYPCNEFSIVLDVDAET